MKETKNNIINIKYYYINYKYTQIKHETKKQINVERKCKNNIYNIRIYYILFNY